VKFLRAIIFGVHSLDPRIISSKKKMSQSVAEAKAQVPVSHDEAFKTGQKFPTPAPGNGMIFMSM
jgi:hypothetical protein